MELFALVCISTVVDINLFTYGPPTIIKQDIDAIWVAVLSPVFRCVYWKVCRDRAIQGEILVGIYIEAAGMCVTEGPRSFKSQDVLV